MDTQLVFLSFLVLAVAQLWIILYFWRLDKTIKSLAELIAGHDLLENRSTALGVLDRAYHKAQNILGSAELESVKFAAKSKLETKQLTEAYEREVDENREKLEKAFLSEADEAYERFASYLDKMTSYVDRLENSRSKIAIDQLAKFQTTAEDRINQELEEYKNAKMASMNKDIAFLIEKTFAGIVPKTIKLSDQTELIFGALEKAKAEKLLTD